MSSPLGPALANIFVGYQEAKLFNIAKRPLVYCRYVDNTFAVFNNEEDCNTFLTHLNSLHPSLRFTYEKESNHSLPFLNVLVEMHDSEFLTSVYRKPTFTGQYLRWNSFSPQRRKINLSESNWYSCSQSFYDLFKKQTGPKAWKNLFNSIGKWLPGTYNQFGFQTKIATTKF